MNHSTRSALRPPRRGKSIGLRDVNTASSSPGIGASHWSHYNALNDAGTTTLLAANSVDTAAGLGTAASA